MCAPPCRLRPHTTPPPHPTTTTVSTVSLVAMFLLLISEFVYYRSPSTETHLVVDTTPAEDIKVAVQCHVTFFHAPCPSIQVHFRDHKGVEVGDANLIATRVPWFGGEDGHPGGMGTEEGEGDGCSVAVTVLVPKVCWWAVALSWRHPSTAARPPACLPVCLPSFFP